MKMHELAESIIERIVPNADGSLPDPSINRLTGKPNPPAAEPAPAPSNVKPGGSTVEYGGETYDVMVFGDKSIRPRIARSDKVVSAKVYTMGNKMFVLLDAPTQEDLDEESKGLYYNVNKRKKAGTSRDASSPKAPTAQAWKDAAKTAKSEGVAEAFENDESNMMYRFNSETGRLGQRMIHNNEEQVAHRQGYRDSHESALKVHGVIRSKFKPGKWVQKQGNSWAEVHPFGKPDDVDESATAGTTSAANVGVGAVYNNKPPKQPKNKDGTAKNAVDMKGVNLLTGGSLKR